MTIRLVLCVLEDDPAQVAAIKQSIRITLPDCFVRLEEDGRSFLASLDKEPLPDILVLDINVPVISGFEVLKRIRRRSDLDWLPIVMFSTDDSSFNKVEADRLGANGFYVKPKLSLMGETLKEITEKYSYKGTDKPTRISSLISVTAPIANDDWGSVDDLLDNL